MKTSITEEMKFRQTVVEYAIKYNNNARAARRYKTSRQQVQRWRKKYDGTVQSLANQSRRPHKHPKQHTEKEIKLIQNKYQSAERTALGEGQRCTRDNTTEERTRNVPRRDTQLRARNRLTEQTQPKSHSRKHPRKGTV